MSEDILDRLAQEREIKTIGRIGGGGGVVMMSHDIVQEAIAEITRLREENAKIGRRRWVVQCGCYDDATAILDALRRVHPPLLIEWTDDDGDVSHVEQMQPLPAPPSEGEVN